MQSYSQQPPSYGLTAFRLRNFEPFRRALLQRPYFREHAALAEERARDPGSGASSSLAYSQLQASAFNVCLSDNLTFDAGLGVETVYTALRGPVGAEVPAGHPAAAGARAGAVVAPWQLINHMPNSAALVNKAGLIRSLHRFYSSAEGGGGADAAAVSQHVFECVCLRWGRGPRALLRGRGGACINAGLAHLRELGEPPSPPSPR
jgi:hypothetical protein